MLTIEQIRERILKSHDGKVTLDESTLISNKEKARFVDSDFGEWWATPYHVMNGQGHPKRGRLSTQISLRLPAEVVLERLKVKHGNQVTLDELTYVECQRRARFVDSEYGEWWAKPSHVLNGQRHPQRATVERIQEYGAPNRLRLDDVIERIQKCHGILVTLDASTYQRVNAKARFIDAERGEWWGYVGCVLKGSGHPSRTHDKWLDTCKKFEPIPHWKSGKACAVQSSYEHAVLTWLNQHKIDYEWQLPFETLLTDKRGRKRTYIVDLLITSGEFVGKYVEIKGTWDTKVGALGKQKWEWFHATHPNSELWTERRLVELGVFSSGKTYLRSLRDGS